MMRRIRLNQNILMIIFKQDIWDFMVGMGCTTFLYEYEYSLFSNYGNEKNRMEFIC